MHASTAQRAVRSGNQMVALSSSHQSSEERTQKAKSKAVAVVVVVVAVAVANLIEVVVVSLHEN